MKEMRIARIPFVGTLCLATLLLCGTAVAQNAHVRGVIVGRSGATMTVKFQDAGTVDIVLNDNTEVRQTEAKFDLREKHYKYYVSYKLILEQAEERGRERQGQ